MRLIRESLCTTPFRAHKLRVRSGVFTSLACQFLIFGGTSSGRLRFKGGLRVLALPLVVFLQIEYDLLDSLIDQLASPIRLLER